MAGSASSIFTSLANIPPLAIAATVGPRAPSGLPGSPATTFFPAPITSLICTIISRRFISKKGLCADLVENALDSVFLHRGFWEMDLSHAFKDGWRIMAGQSLEFWTRLLHLPGFVVLHSQEESQPPRYCFTVGSEHRIGI